MISEEQWVCIGDSVYYGAPCYVKDGEFKSTTNVDCLCRVEEKRKED